MRYIVDVNYSRHPELEQLLQDGHDAILPDDWLIEICKANTPIYMLSQNTSILRQHPDQIFILKSRGDLFREDQAKSAHLSSDDLIDFESTQMFRRWLSNFNELDKLNHLFKKHLEQRVDNQKFFVDSFLVNSVEKLKKCFLETPEDKKQYNDKSTKIQHLKEISLEVHINTKGNTPAKNSLTYALVFILLWRTMKWALDGGIEGKIKKGNLTNDGFDINYILFSVFFDGLKTKEKWLLECREDLIASWE